jgi:hypothetical protein
MTPTTITLPEELKERAERSAEHLGITFDELVRDSLESRLREVDSSPGEDPFFSDREVYRGTPSDFIEKLDDELYGTEG